MDAFSATELAGMQATNESAMMDTCIVQGYTATTDPFGQPTVTYVDRSPIACGFNPKGGREVAGEDTAPIITDASVRLPIATIVDRKDRVKITHRFGVVIAPQVYEIVSEPRRGPSGLVLDLRMAAL